MSPRSSRVKAPISKPATSGVPRPAMAWAMVLVTRSAAPARVGRRCQVKGEPVAWAAASRKKST